MGAGALYDSESSEDRMFKLVISDDEGKTTTVPLVRDEITIGRKEGNTIRLTDRNVSRRHAKLQKSAGGYVLQDLGSYNGTVINGTRLSDQRALKMGDQIVIGDYKLNIVEENGAQVAPAASAPTAAPQVETFQAPAPTNGHHPQATMPAIPSAIGVPAPPTIAVPEHIKRLQLVFLAPAGTPPSISLSKLPVLLGRSEIADVSLPFSSISREHAKITLDGEQLVIEDLGSSNGVVVNGERVKRAPIKHGDKITMGVVECKITRDGEATAVIAVPTSAASVVEPEAQKKSSAGMLVGVGVLVAVLGGGGVMFAMKNNSTPNSATNSTVVSGEPSPSTGTSAAQPATQPTSNGANAATVGATPPPSPAGDPPPRVAQPEPPSNHNPTQEPDMHFAPPSTNSSAARASGDPPLRRVRNQGAPTSESSTSVSNASATSATSATSSQRGSSPSSGASASGASASNGASAASGQTAAQCLLASNFQCVVDLLRGRAATEVEFNQLVTAYQGLSNHSAAEQTMRRYLTRFPEGRYADRYRNILGQ